MSDWLRSKLGDHIPQPSQFGLRVPPAPVQQPQQAPVPHTPQPAPVPAMPQQASTNAVLDHIRSNPDGKVGIMDAISAWEGGPAARLEGDMMCPSCGDGTGYTAYSGTHAHQKMDANGNPVRGRTHCYLCGFNGSYTQGDQANWA